MTPPLTGNSPAPTKSNGLKAIIQKELRRFFTDRRIVLTTVVLPGLMIFLIYSFIGSAVSSSMSVSSDYEPKVYAVNLPNSLASVASGTGMQFEQIRATEIDAIKEQVASKEVDLLMVFPEDFDERIARVMSGTQSAPVNGGAVPEVSLFYNSTRIESAVVFSQVQYLLNAFKESMQPVFSVNTGELSYDLASQEDTVGQIFASLLPILLMIFLYTGCISVAPESIAGEKERGTIATLLVTPLKRWELALGKILSLCVIALLSGASSFLGVMLSLPRLLSVNAEGDAASGGMSLLADISIYSPQAYLMLLAIILSTVLLFVGIISVISAFARTVKEANTMMMPLMIVVLLVAASAMFQTSSTTEPLFYLIPAYNSVQSLSAIFSFSAEPLFIILTVVVNCLAAGVCVFALARMFESERVIFSK